jgi:aspartyl/glutamyl-tRNA(Asn/Gln) amidotransferase C subunit
MVTISKEDVLKLANISRLTVHEDEIEALRVQLQEVLNYAQRVQEISQSVQEKREEHPSVAPASPMRTDTPISFDGISLVELSAHHEADYFIVPAVLQTNKEG